MDKNQVRICVPVCERSLREFERKILSAADVADIIELRLDCIEPLELEQGVKDLGSRVRELGRPTIMTFRPAEQGGLRELDYASRIVFWNMLHYPGTADFLDIELDLCAGFSSSKNPPPLTKKWEQIICSYHDFVGVPSDLDEIYERMAATPARILKIAVRADDVNDCLPVFHLLKRATDEGREIIAVAMGMAGVVTRILGPSRGAYLTYGALDDESTTAPGQVTARELREVYRIEKIDRDTQITGLIGNPVGHSISPQIQNRAFEAAGLNAVFIPLEVHDLNSFMSRMVRRRSREIDWNLRGLSVTAPHKVTVMQHLDWIEPLALEIGAVNTIVVEADALLGYNTDAPAALKPVSEKLGALRDSRCAVIGAGGVAKAVLWSLRNQGARATVFARDPGKGRTLAEKFDAGSERLEGASFKEFDFVINATPMGTRGVHEAETPAAAVQLRGARLAYDLVYNPSETLFLKEARAAGCDTIGGLAMLVLQAAEQLKLWTGAEASVNVMREAAERALR